MRSKWLLFLPLIFVVGIAVQLQAQAWSGVLSSSRAIDWSQAGVPGGVPNATKQCGTTITAYSGTAAAINNAIAACAGSNQYVLLGPGNFNLSTGIVFAPPGKAVLRGSGPDQTFLIFSGTNICGGMGGDICIIANGVGPGSGIPGGQIVNWTAGYAPGTTQLTLSSTTGIQPGTVLVLDQQDDATDNGTVYECQTQNVCGNDRPAGSGRTGRGQEQFVRVTAVSGSTVTIAPGIYMPNWRTSQNPQAWWAGTAPISGVGIESLSADHSASTSAKSGIYFFNAYGSWVKNVRDLNSAENHVWIYQSAHITVRDSYFYGTQNAAENSYGVETYMGGDSLIENNIFQKAVSPTLNSSTSGNVFAYNFSVNDYFAVGPGWMMSAHWEHAIGDEMLLYEGNTGPGYIADNVHGTHHFNTLFRNSYAGWQNTCAGQPCLQQTVGVHLYTHSRYFNVIGNVLGTPGYHTNYTDCYGNSPCITSPDGKGDVSIFTLGWCGNEGTNTKGSNGCGSSMSADANAATSLMRWGNYDTVTSTSRFVSSEVPSGLSQFANPVPRSQDLPASFYLGSKPSWWGTMPWPAIGPDVSGGTGPGGYAYNIPAAVCYAATPTDGNGILKFNADNCYSAANVQPPTNLKATVH